jgi:hypothetical protein
MTNCFETTSKTTDLKVSSETHKSNEKNFEYVQKKEWMLLFTHQIWRNKWEFITPEIQFVKWTEKTNLCGNYCDLILRKIQTFKSCQRRECWGRIDVIEFRQRFKSTKFGRSCDGNWFSLLFSTQITKWWNIIRKFCQMIWWQIENLKMSEFVDLMWDVSSDSNWGIGQHPNTPAPS